MAYVKLTDKQHKRMIARYAECQNYSVVAREFGVSVNTVKKHCLSDKETAKLCKQKNDENVMDMFSFMDSQKGKVQDTLKNIMIALNDPEKLAKTSPRDLATAYGILVDKYCMISPKDSEEMLNKAKAVLGKIEGVIE